MTSLAASFLEDLDELSDHSNEDEIDNNSLENINKLIEINNFNLQENTKINKGTNDSLNKKEMITLRESIIYNEHLEKVKKYLLSENNINSNEFIHNNMIYDLVVASNEFMVKVDDEIVFIHRKLIEIYGLKFPELESLVPNPSDYVRVVKRIGNEMDITLVHLNDLLPSAIVMGVSVTASTTSGKSLSNDLLKKCFYYCDEIVALEKDKNMILQFVQERMNIIAPNVSCILDSKLTAQLLGIAGGIVPLSRMPSCNLLLLGYTKRDLAGFSSISSLKHAGLIYYSDLIQNIPVYLRQRALRVLAAKVILAARIDASSNNSNKISDIKTNSNYPGATFRKEMEEKFEKWQEPEKAKTKKALPIPDEKPRRKRGGKRYRKQKEKLELTDLRKEYNRQTFGATNEEEYGDNAMGITAGRIGKEGTGNLRIIRKEKKKLDKKLKSASYAATNGTHSSLLSSGLTSSLAFTPIQGIELMNPNAAAARLEKESKKYFSNDSGFTSIIKSSLK